MIDRVCLNRERIGIVCLRFDPVSVIASDKAVGHTILNTVNVECRDILSPEVFDVICLLQIFERVWPQGYVEILAFNVQDDLVV